MGRRKVIFGLVLSLIFVYLILWKPHFAALFTGKEDFLASLFGHPRLDFAHLGVILGEVRLKPLIICFFITPIHVLVRAHRWSLMVRNLGRLSLYNSFSLQMVGYLANSILPLRMGEVVRGVMLAQRMGIPNSSGLGTVLIERILDMVSMLVVVLTVSFLFPFPRELAEGAIAFGAMAAVGLVVTLYLALDRDPFGGRVGRLLGDGKVGSLIRQKGGEFAAGFALFRKTENHIVILAETVALWLLYALQGYLVLIAFDFPKLYPLIGHEPILASFVILVINAIGVSLPSAPAGVGTFHAILIFGLSLFDVATDHAAGFALVIHAISVVFFILAGIPFMWREGLHFGEMKELEVTELKKRKEERTGI